MDHMAPKFQNVGHNTACLAHILTMQTMLVMQSDPKAIYVGHCKIMLVLQA
jgi:hypothetical protein